MPDLRFVVFAARRKPLPTSWSRAARAGGHWNPFEKTIVCAAGKADPRATEHAFSTRGLANGCSYP